MIKVKSRFLAFLLGCILLIGCVANSQVITAQTKPELARAVLLESGISAKYNLYLSNSIDMVFPPPPSPPSSRDSKLRRWLLPILEQEAGWGKIEDKYLARLVASFSESELKELLSLAKLPLVKKLLQEEITAYSDASDERRRLLFKVWEDYSNGLHIQPPDVLK
ncbi:MAG: DUF2059 domain-containing protein [Thermosynechococcaceae cyanobacterium]